MPITILMPYNKLQKNQQWLCGHWSSAAPFLFSYTRTHLTNTRAHTRTHTHKHTHVSLHSTRRSASWHLVSVHKVCPGLVVPADHLPGVWGVDVLDWVCKMGACVVLVHITVYDYLVHIIVLVSDSVLPLCLVLLCVLFHCRTLNTSVPLTQCGSRS
jgi:hypothetical protein